MQLQLNPNTQKKKTPKLSENHKLMEQAIEKKTKRRKLDVLEFMDVTRAVSHFEMSALNATAPLNAAGVHVYVNACS